jgi:carbonic anhydrase
VRELAVPLVVVLGHTRCRAIQAGVDVVTGRAAVVGHEAGVIEALRPALAGTPSAEAAGRAAVLVATERLRTSAPILAAAVDSGAVEVAGWLYDVDTGIVEMLV